MRLDQLKKRRTYSRTDTKTSDEAPPPPKKIAEEIRLGKYLKSIRRIYINKTGQNRKVNKDICKGVKENKLSQETV